MDAQIVCTDEEDGFENMYEAEPTDEKEEIRLRCRELEAFTNELQDKLAAYRAIVPGYETSGSNINIVFTSETINDKDDTLLDPEERLKNMQILVDSLRAENTKLNIRCLEAERDRTKLRTNIRKVSTSWFEKKARISESDLNVREDSSDSPTRQLSISMVEASVQTVPLISSDPICLASLQADLKYKDEQIELSKRRCTDLLKRVKDYEKVIDDQEIIIHGMKDQLDTYFMDNQKMSKQISTMNMLFEEIENMDQRNSYSTVPETSETVPEEEPVEMDVEGMAGSVSKTYLKLKDLIYEKKSLITEIERLKTLNVELQRRVAQQESRLLNVTDALHEAWLLVSNLKDQHAQLHTAESVLRYELREKREILQELRKELEWSREQWQIIRQKNSETEREWIKLKEELEERRRLYKEESTKSDVADALLTSEKNIEYVFEPPVDLLLDLGIEYGCVDADDDTSTTAISILEGQDINSHRLEDLENQCNYLYQKLMASTSRSLALASRLSSLHEHYGSVSDDDEEYTEEEVDDEDNEENEVLPFETQVVSPDSESYDTAYVSEADSATGLPDNGDTPVPVSNSESENASKLAAASSIDEVIPDLISEASDTEETTDDLSRLLINFLPKKIEILRNENRRLEERCSSLQEEKLKAEAMASANLEAERRLRRQLEDQLAYLGKYVDELKLERSGKIAEFEDQLKQKVARLDQQQEKYEDLEGQLEALEAKHKQRGDLLRIGQEELNWVKEENNKLKNEIKENEIGTQTLRENHEIEIQGVIDQVTEARKEMRRIQDLLESEKSETENLRAQLHELEAQFLEVSCRPLQQESTHTTENLTNSSVIPSNSEPVSSNDGTLPSPINQSLSSSDVASQRANQLPSFKDMTSQWVNRKIHLNPGEELCTEFIIEEGSTFSWRISSQNKAEDSYFRLQYHRPSDSKELLTLVPKTFMRDLSAEVSITGHLLAKRTGSFCLTIGNNSESFSYDAILWSSQRGTS